MIIKSNQKTWNQLENYQKSDRKLYGYAQILLELDFPIYCGRCTSWHDQSQNGGKVATKDWHDE